MPGSGEKIAIALGNVAPVSAPTNFSRRRKKDNHLRMVPYEVEPDRVGTRRHQADHGGAAAFGFGSGAADEAAGYLGAMRRIQPDH